MGSSNEPGLCVWLPSEIRISCNFPVYFLGSMPGADGFVTWADHVSLLSGVRASVHVSWPLSWRSCLTSPLCGCLPPPPCRSTHVGLSVSPWLFLAPPNPPSPAIRRQTISADCCCAVIVACVSCCV